MTTSDTTPYTALGLMSGTSLDGIDLAVIRTDGRNTVESLGFSSTPYPEEMRALLRSCLGLKEDPDGRVAEAARRMTALHIDAIQAFLAETPTQLDLIGFHGQTIFHDPDNRMTWQIGDPQMLADTFKTEVVADFRSADVAAGGQGAPLIPLFHQAKVRAGHQPPFPVAVLNLGGVGNITWIGKDTDDVVACDTGPGNALIDDWMLQQTGEAMDKGGQHALHGWIDESRIAHWLDHPFFAKRPPKSLDRDAFAGCMFDTMALKVDDGAATLAAFTADCVVVALDHMPAPPKALYVTGGGRHNHAIMQRLRERLGVIVESVDVLGWNGDGLEAEGFAYLARTF